MVRRSNWVARQQTKWVLVGFLVLVTTIVSSVPADAAGQLPRLQLVFVLAEHLAFALIGIGLTFAVLRHRLYDAGLALWRAFAYSMGVVGVLVGYFVLITWPACRRRDRPRRSSVSQR